jgi:hypothetical protein
MSSYPPPSYTPAPQNSTTAIVSLVAGILGWTFVPGLGAIVAVITGHMAKSEIKKSMGTLGGDGMATAGLILGYSNIALGLCIVCIAVVIPLMGLGLTIPFLNSGY